MRHSRIQRRLHQQRQSLLVVPADFREGPSTESSAIAAESGTSKTINRSIFFEQRRRWRGSRLIVASCLDDLIPSPIHHGRIEKMANRACVSSPTRSQSLLSGRSEADLAANSKYPRHRAVPVRALSMDTHKLVAVTSIGPIHATYSSSRGFRFVGSDGKRFDWVALVTHGRRGRNKVHDTTGSTPEAVLCPLPVWV